LYWHHDERCWDNSRRGARHYETLAVPQRAAAVDQAVPGVHTTVYYPELQVNAWPLPQLPLGSHDMSHWPVLLDVDINLKFDPWRDRVIGSFK
jgi:hypothetical protein